GIDTARGNNITGKRSACVRIDNGYARLGIVALALECSRKRLILHNRRNRERQKILRPEKEQLVPVPIKVGSLKEHRATDKIAGIVKTVARTRQAILVVEEFVRIEVFIAEEVVGAAVKLGCSALNDGVDRAA